MDLDIRSQLAGELSSALPETPHELPLNRARVVELLTRVKNGEQIDLLGELLAAVDWRAAFVDDQGRPLTLEDISKLHAYYREKFSDVGPIYLADLLSTEFMTEQRAQGDVVFSDRLMRLGARDPDLWNEIRQFFRRKEAVSGMLLLASTQDRGPE
jgi:hypothetical protein